MHFMHRSLSIDAAKTLVNAFITSRIDYCNSVFSRVAVTHLRPLKSVLNSAARLIVKKHKYNPITATIHDVLQWLPIQQRIEYNLCDLVYKAMHRTALVYLTELYVPVSIHQGRANLRSATHFIFILLCPFILCNKYHVHCQHEAESEALWRSSFISWRPVWSSEFLILTWTIVRMKCCEYPMADCSRPAVPSVEKLVSRSWSLMESQKVSEYRPMNKAFDETKQCRFSSTNNLVPQTQGLWMLMSPLWSRHITSSEASGDRSSSSRYWFVLVALLQHERVLIEYDEDEPSFSLRSRRAPRRRNQGDCRQGSRRPFWQHCLWVLVVYGGAPEYDRNTIRKREKCGSRRWDFCQVRRRESDAARQRDRRSSDINDVEGWNCFWKVAAKPVEGRARNTEAGVKSIEEDVVV